MWDFGKLFVIVKFFKLKIKGKFFFYVGFLWIWRNLRVFEFVVYFWVCFKSCN